MPKVLIGAASLANIESPFVHVLKNAGFELVYSPVNRQMVEDELMRALGGITASVAGSEPYTAAVLDAHPQLRVIARVGVGYDAVDVPAATQRGVAVAIAPNTNQDAVAEHAFCLILALTKNLISQHIGTRNGEWPRGTNLPLRGRVLGIAGLGRIGKAMALRGEAFRMKLLAFEPYPDKAFAAAHNIGLVPFEQLLAESDFLSLHLPMSAASRHLINRQTLAQMKPTAFLINTARGGLVCEADLLDALRTGRLAGAGLDVFEQEPPPRNPLLELDNVVLTPHAAGGDLQSRDDMARSAAEAVVSLSRGEWPAEKIVNPEVRSRFRWA
jgi:D-3-phosphoglycerate dehydrogenase / 2-oxoglutarate reductase